MKNRLNWKSIYQNPSFPSFLILIAIIFLNAFLQHNFFTYRAFKSNLLTFTPLILTSIAQGLVILVGCVDLSLGATISLITVLMASLMGDSLLSMVFVVFFGSGLALLMSFINGFIISYFGPPPLLTTMLPQCFGSELLSLCQRLEAIYQVILVKCIEVISSQVFQLFFFFLSEPFASSFS